MSELPRTFKIVTVWLLIGLAVFLAFQVLQARHQRMQFTQHDGVVEIRRAADGHYHWRGSLNGEPVDFLVDTGATATAVPAGLAQRAGLQLEGSVTSSTAGGLVEGRLARADLALEGGPVARNLMVTVLPALEAPLLGMDVLGRLHLSQRGGVLRIEGAGTP